ncbi:MAG: hypothetical protein ACUVRN_04000 [Candidatus Caldatribacteriaceae bacterium]
MKRFPALFFLIVVVFLLISCFNLERVKNLRYEITLKKQEGSQEGFLDVSLPLEGQKNQAKIDFALGEEKLSTTLDVEEENPTNALFPLIMTNPALAKVLTPLGTVQGMVMAMSIGGTPGVGFEIRQKDDQGRMVEFRIPSAENRFGKEALWIESYVDGNLIFRVLVERETFFPLVLNLRDPEILEEGEIGVYFEITEIEWRE